MREVTVSVHMSPLRLGANRRWSGEGFGPATVARHAHTDVSITLGGWS